MKFLFGIFLLFSVFVIIGCGSNEIQATTTTVHENDHGHDEDDDHTTETIVEDTRNIIEFSDGKYKPSTLTIKKGETVIFLNNDISSTWPASNIHPTHGQYPEEGGCIGSNFDACKPLKTGENYSFTFTEVGSWKFHDHVKPSAKGSIIVEEWF
ncbi:hypothetical protein CL617_00770 [archaeon]|nr:hypothetical protein [archaeon]|tara:strand:- start:7198 stop:7659 length:462 start_codon:yes stop_codon:yes gene_type:complete